MRKPTPTVSASTPTLTPPVERKCATCAHCNDFAYECQQHDQTAVYRDGYRIVVQCDGYTEAGQ
jgi:hypothetical protein